MNFMKFDKWNTTDKQPVQGCQFVAKLKGKDQFIFANMLSDNGWVACISLGISESRDWSIFKDNIEYWYDVREIGQ